MYVKFERCDKDDPKRCQATGLNGQCPFKAMPESKYCTRHGATELLGGAKKDLDLYQVAKYQDKINRMEKSPKLKTLQSEVAIARMMLEQQLNRCETEQDLLIREPRITELLREIGKLVQACQKLDESMGVVLDANQAKAFINDISKILTTYINDANVLEMVSEDLTRTLNTYIK